MCDVYYSILFRVKGMNLCLGKTKIELSQHSPTPTTVADIFHQFAHGGSQILKNALHSLVLRLENGNTINF